jgi:hypothetical protein
MKTIELQLDEQTYERAQKLAQARFSTLEAWVTDIINQLILIDTEADPLLGMFADEPELMDQVIEAALSARETDPLRQING